MGGKRGYPSPRISWFTPVLLRLCTCHLGALLKSRVGHTQSFWFIGRGLGSIHAAGSGTTLWEPLMHPDRQTDGGGGPGSWRKGAGPKQMGTS